MSDLSIEYSKYGKIIWNDEMISFVKENHNKMTNRQLADAMGLKLTSLRTQCYSMGLYKQELEYWTKEQVDFLMAYYEMMGDVEMVEIFTALYPKKKGWSKKHIEKKRRYLKLKRSKSMLAGIQERNTQQGRFSEHHWKRWDGLERKQGEVVAWRNNDSYQLVVKWSGGDISLGYVKLAHLNWMLYVGTPITEGMNIVHKDGDPLNCDWTNLKMVTHAELALINSAASSKILSDNYVRGIMSTNNKAIRHLIPTELIALKRQQLLLNRQIENGQS